MHVVARIAKTDLIWRDLETCLLWWKFEKVLSVGLKLLFEITPKLEEQQIDDCMYRESSYGDNVMISL